MCALGKLILMNRSTRVMFLDAKGNLGQSYLQIYVAGTINIVTIVNYVAR